MASKYEVLANEIVGLLGGRDNISFFTHCITRLRFNVKDKGLVQVKKVEKLPGTVGSQWVGYQYQVIIGTAVDDVYRLICEKNGLEELPEVEADDAAPTGKLTAKTIANKIFDAISGSLAPIIPILTCGGMLKILMMFMGYIGIPEEDGAYQIISFVQNGCFYFLPVFIAAFAAKNFRTNVGVAYGHRVHTASSRMGRYYRDRHVHGFLWHPGLPRRLFFHGFSGIPVGVHHVLC